MPRLKPLQEWYCDKCGDIVNIDRGWVEWINPLDETVHSFHIVHNDDKCYFHDREYSRSDLPVTNLLGPDGLQWLLSFLDPKAEGDSQRFSRSSLASIQDIFRRLHVPHYEEARRYFRDATYDGSDLRDLQNSAPDELINIIERYEGP